MTNILWNNASVEAATGSKSTQNWSASGISIDSRRVNKGDLFIAIKGEKFDGHEFINNAFIAGASACIAHYKPNNVSDDLPVVVVGDTMKALYDLASFNRKRTKAKIIAITGSVGKTSTKEMLATAFQALGDTYYTEGNLNNHIGLPLSMARMPENSEFGVFEIGMNHAGEIAPLAKLCQADVAIITNVAAVHLEFFNSVAEIANAKAEIFNGATENTRAVLNFDNEYYKILKNAAIKSGIKTIYSFGTNEQANPRLLSYSGAGSHAVVRTKIDDNEFEYNLGINSKHQILNSLATIAAVAALGLDYKKAANSLATVTAKPGRGKIYDIEFRGKKLTIIDDCYNASPASVEAALDNFGKIHTSGRKLAILGDMLELGAESVVLHKNLLPKLLYNKIDLLFTAGELMSHLISDSPPEIQGGSAMDSSNLADVIIHSIKSGDTLLIKGSRGMRMENIINALAKDL